MRTAAAAVAEGGTLLIVGHADWPSWETDPDPHVVFPTPDDVLADLALSPKDWEVRVARTYNRHLTGPDGRAASRRDNTVRVWRRGAGAGG